MRSGHLKNCAWSLCALALLWCSVSSADPAADKQAKAKFVAAQAAYDVGQFDKALDLYGAAYNLKPLPAFLFNMAQCHKQLANYERALFFYRRFLAQAPRGTDTETVEQLIVAMEKKQAEKEQLARTQEDSKRQEAQLEIQRAREAAARAEIEAADRKAKLVPELGVGLPPPPPTPLPESPGVQAVVVLDWSRSGRRRRRDGRRGRRRSPA